MKKIKKDKIMKAGEGIDCTNGGWTFDGDVVNSFDEHVQKSVPGYQDGHILITNLAPFFMGGKNDNFYEIGCSTGRLTKLVASNTANKTSKFIGIDAVKKMIEKAKELKTDSNCAFYHKDALTFEYKNAALIASYYTLQFIDTGVRQDLVNKIYSSLKWGGAFILFEKVRGPDARFQDIMTTLYTEYKLRQGYSESEIINKMLSLKGKLEPFSTQGNIDLLRRAGFVDYNIIFKNIGFEGYLAIK